MIFERYLNIKFHENPPSRSQVLLREPTEGQTNEANRGFSQFLRMRLTLILLTWRIWWAPNNASRWQMGL